MYISDRLTTKTASPDWTRGLKRSPCPDHRPRASRTSFWLGNPAFHPTITRGLALSAFRNRHFVIFLQLICQKQVIWSNLLSLIRYLKTSVLLLNLRVTFIVIIGKKYRSFGYKRRLLSPKESTISWSVMLTSNGQMPSGLWPDPSCLSSYFPTAFLSAHVSSWLSRSLHSIPGPSEPAIFLHQLTWAITSNHIGAWPKSLVQGGQWQQDRKVEVPGSLSAYYDRMGNGYSYRAFWNLKTINQDRILKGVRNIVLRTVKEQPCNIASSNRLLAKYAWFE